MFDKDNMLFVTPEGHCMMKKHRDGEVLKMHMDWDTWIYLIYG